MATKSWFQWNQIQSSEFPSQDNECVIEKSFNVTFNYFCMGILSDTIGEISTQGGTSEGARFIFVNNSTYQLSFSWNRQMLRGNFAFALGR